MNAFGVFVEFGAPSPASDGFDFRYFFQQRFRNQSQAVAFLKRDARIEREADRERSFVEGG